MLCLPVAFQWKRCFVLDYAVGETMQVSRLAGCEMHARGYSLKGPEGGREGPSLDITYEKAYLLLHDSPASEVERESCKAFGLHQRLNEAYKRQNQRGGAK